MRTFSRPRVPGASPEPGWTFEQHQAAAAAYWADIRRHDGTSARPHIRMTTSQHILHLLISVFTFGLWLPVWFYLANFSGKRTGTAGDPSSPMPVWPPSDPSAWTPRG